MIIGSLDINLSRNKALINRIAISGRNLIRVANLEAENADEFDKSNYLYNGSLTYRNLTVASGKMSCFTVDNMHKIPSYSDMILHFDYRVVSGILSSLQVDVHSGYIILDTKVDGISQEGTELPLDGLEHQVTVYLQRSNEVQTDGKICLLINEGLVDIVEIAITSLKLETGNKATGFSPAPEDIVTSLDNQNNIIAQIKEDTTPTRIIEAVVYSNEINSLLESKANVEDLAGFATGEEVTGQLQAITEYVDTRQALADDTINELSSRLTKTEADITAKFGLTGGINLIQNSVGYFGTDLWAVTGGLRTTTTVELERLQIGSAFYSDTTSPVKATQNIPATGGDYTISFFVKKPQGSGNAFITIGYADGTKLFEFSPFGSTELSNEYRAFAYTFTMPEDAHFIRVGIEVDTAVECTIAGLMLTQGTTNYSWTPHRTENANTNIQMNINGLKVIGSDGGYTVMSPDEFSGYAPVTDEVTNTTEMERIFTLNGDTTEVNRLSAKRSIDIGTLVIVPVKNALNEGWAIVNKE